MLLARRSREGGEWLPTEIVLESDFRIPIGLCWVGDTLVAVCIDGQTVVVHVGAPTGPLRRFGSIRETGGKRWVHSAALVPVDASLVRIVVSSEFGIKETTIAPAEAPPGGILVATPIEGLARGEALRDAVLGPVGSTLVSLIVPGEGPEQPVRIVRVDETRRAVEVFRSSGLPPPHRWLTLRTVRDPDPEFPVNVGPVMARIGRHVECVWAVDGGSDGVQILRTVSWDGGFNWSPATTEVTGISGHLGLPALIVLPAERVGLAWIELGATGQWRAHGKIFAAQGQLPTKVVPSLPFEIEDWPGYYLKFTSQGSAAHSALSARIGGVQGLWLWECRPSD
ncbi:MAG: hypothetical protein HUU15_09665 [Candidatus Brocadiae bacterium]|nr:hypothetical protein [Candidatus Brocadiia bacterium]